MNEQLTIDQLTITLQRSARRKTIGITIERNGEVLITAPENCPTATIEALARRKQAWIYSKLAQQTAQQHRSEKQFITGEGHFYLGRSYRLLLVEQGPPLTLHDGRFRLWRAAQAQAESHFARWYTQQAETWLPARVRYFSELIGVGASPQLSVRDLGFRWGAWYPDQRINFHWRVMQLPVMMIEYIIAHELVHMLEPHHQRPFWQRLGRAMPDYLARKQWLQIYGGGL